MNIRTDTRGSESAIHELRHQWHVAFGSAPPLGLGRDLMSRAISWQSQAQVQAGHSASVVRRLKGLQGQLDRSGGLYIERRISIKPGTDLIRNWNGRCISVSVLEDGFLHEGKKYASLSHVARAITGARWSGPRFFGLRPRPKRGGTND